MTQPQNAKIQATITALAEAKNKDRKEYFLGLCDILGLKHIKSSKQLSKKEASAIIEKLDEIEELET